MGGPVIAGSILQDANSYRYDRCLPRRLSQLVSTLAVFANHAPSVKRSLLLRTMFESPFLNKDYPTVYLRILCYASALMNSGLDPVGFPYRKLKQANFS